MKSNNVPPPSSNGHVEKPLRVLIADDHRLFRDSLAALLDSYGVERVSTAGSGQEALEKARQHLPDIVVMDLDMPGMHGLEATRRFAREFPGTPVVILTASECDQHLVAALRSGASGYLLKDLDGERFMSYLKSALRGEPVLSPHLTKRLVNGFANPRTRNPDALTERELEVLGLMAEGITTNRKLADELGVSDNTVKFHIRNILDKLHLNSRAEAVGYALRNHLVDSTLSALRPAAEESVP